MATTENRQINKSSDTNSINYSNQNITSSYTNNTQPTTTNNETTSYNTNSNINNNNNNNINNSNNTQVPYYGGNSATSYSSIYSNTNVNANQKSNTTSINNSKSNIQAQTATTTTTTNNTGYSNTQVQATATNNTGYSNTQAQTTATNNTTGYSYTQAQTTITNTGYSNSQTGYSQVSQAPTTSGYTTMPQTGYNTVSQSSTTAPATVPATTATTTTTTNNIQEYNKYSTTNQFSSMSSYDGINNTYSSSVSQKLTLEDKSYNNSSNQQVTSQLNTNNFASKNTITPTATTSIPTITDTQIKSSPNSNFQEIDPNAIHSYQNQGTNYNNNSNNTNTQVKYDNSDLDDLVLGSNETKDNKSYYQQSQEHNNNQNSFTNFPNSSAPQINYYTKNENSTYNTTANSNAINSSTTASIQQQQQQQYSANTSTSVSTSSSNQNLNAITNNNKINPNTNTNMNTGLMTNTYSAATTNPITAETSNTNNNSNQLSSIYLKQNKTSQNFYLNSSTSNSSPCLNSMITSSVTSTPPPPPTQQQQQSTTPQSMSLTNGGGIKGINGNERKKHSRANSSVYSRSSYINDIKPMNSTTTGMYKSDIPMNSLLYTEDQNSIQFRSPTAPPLSDSRLSPSSTTSNLNRPPSVPPSYTPYSSYANTMTTSNTILPPQTSSSSTAAYQNTTSSINNNTNNQVSMYQNQNQIGNLNNNNIYSTTTAATTTTNQYGITTNNYQNTTTTPGIRYNTTSTPDPQGSFYNFGNQSNSEIHSCDPMIIHKNKSPIVSIGFGGKIAVIFPKVTKTYTGEEYYAPGSVHIKPISNLIYPHIVQKYKEYEGPIMGQKKSKKQILDIITKQINKIKEQSQHYGNYSINDIDTDEVLLLKIIQLYIENDGSIFGQTSKPEAVKKLQELLMTNNNNNLPISNLTTSDSIKNRQNVNSSELSKIQDCLLYGDRPGACKIAMSNKLWAHALIISSYINKETYKDVVLSFIKDELNNEKDKQANLSLKILYSLFAGNGKDSIVENINNQMINVDSKWKEILMMILSNRTPNDVTAITSLGDNLKNNGKLIASHICYMFSTNSISGLYSNNTKVVLLGADHQSNPKKFYQDIDAFQMTEYLEYAYSLSNKNTNLLPHFQAYKLIFAYWLSEIGLANKAVIYTENIMQILKNNNNRSPYLNATLIDGLKELNSRCTAHLSGTKFAVKDGWFSKITKLDTFIEAFDHGLNKFIGTESENPNVPNLSNFSNSSLTAPSSLSLKKTSNNLSANLVPKHSRSYQNISDVYYNKGNNNMNKINQPLTPQLNSKTEPQKGSGVFSLIGNLFNKGSNSTTTTNESYSNSSTIQESNQNKNGYYDSITKQWVSSNNGYTDQIMKNDIAAPPPVASYDPYYNGSMNSNINKSQSINLNGSGNLAGGVIPQFGQQSVTSNITNNSRRSTRAKYNDPTINLTYSNNSIQGMDNNTYDNNQNAYNQTGIPSIPQIKYQSTGDQTTNNYWGNYGN